MTISNERVLFAYGIHTGTLRKSDSCRNLCVEEQPNVRSGRHIPYLCRGRTLQIGRNKVHTLSTVVPEQDEEVRYLWISQVDRYLPKVSKVGTYMF